MESENSECKFHLIGDGGGHVITFSKELLKYIDVFDMLYQASKTTDFNESEDFTLEPLFWDFFFAVLKEHDDMYSEDGPSIPIHLFHSSDVEAMQIGDLYKMVRAAHFYQIPLLLDFLLKRLLERLYDMTGQELVFAHSAVNIPQPLEIYQELQGALQKMCRYYNIRLLQLETIFRHYLGTEDFIQLVRETYFAPTTNVIACCNGSILVATQEGLKAYGKNRKGELGLNDRAIKKTTEWLAVEASAIVSVWCGHDFTLILQPDGLYACGNNLSGKLGLTGIGNNFDDNVFVPTRIAIDHVLSAACGLSHSVMLTSDGVYATGNNMSGQLGIGVRIPTNTPKKMDFDGEAIAVACGHNFSLILTRQGKVYCCGLNEANLVGQDTNKVKIIISPIEIIMPMKIRTPIVSMSAGGEHALFLDSRGLVYASGNNDHGQCGHGDTLNKKGPTLVPNLPADIVAVFAGRDCSFFVDGAGDLYACGDNTTLQLGLAEKGNIQTPTKVWSMSQVIDVACGAGFTAVVTCTGVFILGGAGQHADFKSPVEMSVQIAVEETPICDALVRMENKRPRQTLTCLVCGSCDSLGVDKLTNHLYCSHQCLNAHHTSPLL